MISAWLLLAQAPAAPSGPPLGWTEFGVLGLLVTAFLTGLVVPGYLYKRTEAENDRLRKLIDDKVYPLVETATRTQDNANQVMKDLLNVLAEEARNRPPPPRRRSQ